MFHIVLNLLRHYCIMFEYMYNIIKTKFCPVLNSPIDDVGERGENKMNMLIFPCIQ